MFLNVVAYVMLPPHSCWSRPSNDNLVSEMTKLREESCQRYVDMANECLTVLCREDFGETVGSRMDGVDENKVVDNDIIYSSLDSWYPWEELVIIICVVEILFGIRTYFFLLTESNILMYRVIH